MNKTRSSVLLFSATLRRRVSSRRGSRELINGLVSLKAVAAVSHGTPPIRALHIGDRCACGGLVPHASRLRIVAGLQIALHQYLSFRAGRGTARRQRRSRVALQVESAAATRHEMTKLQAIEEQIKSLSSGELAELREWFLEHDWAEWDQQIEHDSAAGKLDKLFAKARADHAAGKSTKL